MIARGIVFQPENSIDLEPDAATWYDQSRYKNNGVITAGAGGWVQEPSGLWVYDFSGSVVTVTDGLDLDFTAEDMTWMWWGNQSTVAGDYMLYQKGDLNADGIYIQYVANGSLRVVTSQAAAFQLSDIAVGSLVVGVWYFMVVRRIGASVRVFRDAIDITNVVGVHINPLTASAKNTELGSTLIGRAGMFKVLKYALTAGQILKRYEADKWKFGVN